MTVYTTRRNASTINVVINLSLAGMAAVNTGETRDLGLFFFATPTCVVSGSRGSRELHAGGR